uniref:Uncharacterized protein n=1 Tax=Amphimedon queenslandica TaxID=400682 RepID=A0A1X7SW15_AMPQE
MACFICIAAIFLGRKFFMTLRKKQPQDDNDKTQAWHLVIKAMEDRLREKGLLKLSASPYELPGPA